MTPDPTTIVARLREYGNEVLSSRRGDVPPFSNDYECALAALDAADLLDTQVQAALLAAADAVDTYRTANGSPREGFQDAANGLRKMARTGHFPANGTLERAPDGI